MTEPILFRSFNAAFIAYMELRGGWPRIPDIQNEMQKNRRPCKRDYLSRLRHGQCVPLKYPVYYLEAIMLSGANQKLERARATLADFVRERGVPDISREHLYAVEALCCAPVLSVMPDDEEDARFTDWIIAGLSAIAWYPLDRMLHMLLERCSAGDPERVASWTYRVIARERVVKAAAMDRQAVLNAAAQYLDVPFEEYVRRAHAWSSLNPWTVVFAKRGGRNVG